MGKISVCYLNLNNRKPETKNRLITRIFIQRVACRGTFHSSLNRNDSGKSVDIIDTYVTNIAA